MADADLRCRSDTLQARLGAVEIAVRLPAASLCSVLSLERCFALALHKMWLGGDRV